MTTIFKWVRRSALYIEWFNDTTPVSAGAYASGQYELLLAHKYVTAITPETPFTEP